MTTILCVEDNETNVFLISRVLRRAGFSVLVARDGEEGVEMAKSNRPGLILMDLSLPGIDGFEATRRLKADADTRRIPVIALSAHEADDKAEEISACGCESYLTKPLDIPRLLAEIERLLGVAACARSESA